MPIVKPQNQSQVATQVQCSPINTLSGLNDSQSPTEQGFQNRVNCFYRRSAIKYWKEKFAEDGKCATVTIAEINRCLKGTKE